MRTNIEIDDQLMVKAMSAGGYKTKREAVEAGLKLVARQKAYQDILAAKGKLKWTDPTVLDNTGSASRRAGGKTARARKVA
jgi:antitoxin ParD1/3/4